MLLKKLPNAGHFAWSNSKKNNYLFATGSLMTNQELLLNADKENYLQIFSLDTSDKSDQINCMGKTKCEQPFTCLAWDTFDEENQYPYGVIVGGLQDGSLTIWDPNDIITYWKKHSPNSAIEANVGCICYEQNLFNTPVQAIEFNPFKSNLIATGGSSEVLIMNIERNISAPEIFSPGTPNLHQNSTISSVSWNKKVQHILASASLNGLTVVWDLKTNKPIFNFQDSSITYNRNICLSWNPEIPTQIAVSYDDEKNCELQIWDLRNPQGPVMLFGQGHTKGINCVNWCTNDPSLILTGGKDEKILCWNYKTGELVSEMNNGENANNVKWSPKLPSIYSVTSESGNVTINTLNSEEITSYAPKWYKTPIFARFGRNNKLMAFNEEKSTLVTEFQIVKPNDAIVNELTNFEQMYSEAERTHDFIKMCDMKLSSQELSSQSKTHWSFIKALIAVDKNSSANQIIEVLGFNKNEIIKQSENYTGKTHRKKDDGSPKQASTKVQKNNYYDFTLMSNKDAEGFFDQLSQVSTQKQEKPKSNMHSSEIRKESSSYDQEIVALESISKNVNWDAGIEKIIKQNILIGNYEGAVDCALKCGRTGEALLLAYSHSPSLFEATANAFFVASKDTFIKNVFKNIIEKQNKEIAKSHGLEAWKEVAAMALTSKKPEEFEEIMNILGQRLVEEKNNDDEALLCFLLARNLEKMIEIFKKKISSFTMNSLERKKTVINYAEKLIVLLHILEVKINNNIDFDHILEEFSLIALDYDLHVLAYKILLFASDNSFKIQELKDIIYHSNEEVAQIFKVPAFPFKFESVGLKIMSKIDQKKKPNELKTNIPNNNFMPQENRKPQPNKPEVFVPAKGQPIKGEIGPPKSIVNPLAHNANKIIPPPHAITENNVLKHPGVSGPQTGPFVAKPLQQESVVNNPPPPFPAQKKTEHPLIHPTPPPPKPQPVIENKAINQQFPANNFVAGPPPKKATEFVEKVSDPQPFDYQQNNNNNKNAHFQPPAPKPVQMKSPPFRPPVVGQQQTHTTKPLEQNIKEILKPVEVQKQREEIKESKEIETVKKPIDYNSLSTTSQSMIEVINKMKNVFGVFEPNMRRKMDLEKIMDQLKEMIAADSLKPETYSSLHSLLQHWESGNITEATNIHSKIANSDWEPNKDWIKTIRRVLLRK